ncbi:MEDS domain-containing protein [Streptomyces sp. NPDC058279]|uniref:MEDS domain-containing protein n=1 Tax=Streptomyces sp. NPDC058279 TaxID=3346418 RepID=UPI0036EDADA2
MTSLPQHRRPPAARGEHSFFAYDDDLAWADTVVRFVSNGLERGQRVWYSADSTEPSAVIDVLRRGAVDVDTARRDARLSVTGTDLSYLRRVPFDPDWVISMFRAACAEALADGCTGLRVLGEMSWSARQATAIDRILEAELRLDREVYADLPLTGLCLFDRRLIPAPTADLLTRAHTTCAELPRPPAEAPRPRPPARSAALAAVPMRDRAGIRLSGSGDIDTRHILHSALAALARMPGPIVHLDLSAVTYLDPGAVAVLVDVSNSLTGKGRSLLLHKPPYSLRKVAELFPEECAALEVAA